MQRISLTAAATIILLHGCTCKSSFKDISPANGPATPGGLTLAIAGTDASLFAVSLNAGLWHRTYSSAGVPAWKQLNGPKYATSIATDPTLPTHIVAGERDGDAFPAKLNEAGVWESYDEGVTWKYIFNALSMPAGNGFCTSQAIPSVVITSSGTIIAATACGIARRVKGNAAFSPSSVPAGLGLISVVVASGSKVWARSHDGQLLVSLNDGISFEQATAVPMPVGTSFDMRGDPFSLAASDEMAVMSACCVQGGPAPVQGHPAATIIIYHSTSNTWSTENFVHPDGATVTTGTYVGGRHFVKSFITATGTRFFFCNGQAVWELDGHGTHTLVASTGVDVQPPTATGYNGSMHVDLWDMHLDNNGQRLWIAGDGGISETKLNAAGWKPSNEGYHTLHLQSLEAVPSKDGTWLGFATQDNSDWFGKPGSMRPAIGLGDVNASDADAGSSPGHIFFFRGFASFGLAPLDNTSPFVNSATAPKSILTDPLQPDVAGIIHFIQSVQGETAVPPAALMVVHRPVRDAEKNPVVPPASLAGLGDAGASWLLRNNKWKEEADFYRAIAAGNWLKESELPPGTERVFSTGGHSSTHYFAIVRVNGQLTLMEKRRLPRNKVSTWVTVFSGVIEWIDHCTYWEGWYGPVFVNPYDDGNVYLLSPDGVYVSHRTAAGELVFEKETMLTTLLTASGSYPIVRQTCGGNPTNVVLANRDLGTTTLGHVSFFKDDPTRVIVSSPFTGVFYKTGNEPWRSFANILPSAPVWAVRMDKTKAYIGFNGRSLGQVNEPRKAGLATYFRREQGTRPFTGGQRIVIATLLYSNGDPGVNKLVTLRITGSNGQELLYNPSLPLDALGRVIIPTSLVRAGNVAHLRFTGNEDDGVASSEMHFGW